MEKPPTVIGIPLPNTANPMVWPIWPMYSMVRRLASRSASRASVTGGAAIPAKKNGTNGNSLVPSSTGMFARPASPGMIRGT